MRRRGEAPAPSTSTPEAAKLFLREAAERAWIDHERVHDPPPWSVVETDAGPIEARQIRLPLPDALREGFPVAAVGGEEPDPPIPALFFDTETLGLGSQPIVLAGFAGVSTNGVWLEQVFARDYTREAALLSRSRSIIERAALLVSYNGRSYDLPMLRDRLVRHRLKALPSRPDVDLLHEARRRFKGTLPNCRLTTLEFRLMGRNRQGDIPGGEIPRLYHQCVRTGDATLLAPVFHHNALDLFCLIELVTHLPGVLSPGEAITAP